MQKRYKWVIETNWGTWFFVRQPKKVSGGYMVNGQKWIGDSVRLITREQYDIKHQSHWIM